MKFPVTAIISILHRISGVLIFLSLPLLLFLLFRSLLSQQAFSSIQQSLQGSLLKIVLWGVAASVSYHILAGLRHIIMDFGFAESLTASRISSYVLLMLFLVAAVLLGVWLW